MNPINPATFVPKQIAELIKGQSEPKKRAEHVFLGCTPSALSNETEAWPEIKRSVALALGAPIQSVFVCGSGMLGYSFAKGQPFNKETSDLDVAVLNPNLFIKLLEEANLKTRGFTDLTKFERIRGQSGYDLLSDGIVKHGMIYLRYMPAIPIVSNIRSALMKIGNRYNANFNELTCAVYASENLFIEKQIQIIETARAAI